MNENNEFRIDSPPEPVVQTRTLRPRPLLVRLMMEHNPFYLLSAACMLASCLALTNSLSWSPIPMTRLVTLIVTLNVYEGAVLAIALFLITRRRLQRDGRMLLLLQAFFVADFTFLNAEVASSSPAAWVGVLINAILFGLALLKLGVVMWVLKPDFTPMQFGFVMLQLGALFAIPCVLRQMDGTTGAVGSAHMYGVWWLTALLPALYEVLAWMDPHRRVPVPAIGAAEALRPGYAAPTRAYLALPYVSLLTHLGILHYVYDARFYAAHAAPVLIGLALVLNRYSPTSFFPRRDLLVLRLLLPLGAVLVSLGNPFEFVLGSSYPTVTLTPTNLAIRAAYVTYVYCFLLQNAWIFLSVGAGSEAVNLLGPSRQQIATVARSSWDWATNVAARLVPKGTRDWGVVGLVASFAFLGIGFWVSLRKRPGEVESDA